MAGLLLCRWTPEGGEKIPAIGGISPFFIVAKLDAALEFYRDELGFEITFRGPIGAHARAEIA